MRKFLLIATIIFSCTSSFAKKVKFTVDLDTVTFNPTGVHVMGDFQQVAGFPGGDWLPNTTTMTQEGASTIYSIVVDIPAFTKYEYKFVNGDQSYEAEFVPFESRVGYNFDDNRWIWIDSLADDTTDVGAIVFARNAPMDLLLVRFKVDMHEVATLNPGGVHVAGDFQGWDPSKTILYSFGSGVYEIISYVLPGTYEFKYYNGYSAGDAESIPLTCAVNTNRQIVMNVDTVLHDYTTEFPVCFSSCTPCITAGIAEHNGSSQLNVYPNPATGHLIISNPEFKMERVEVYNAQGALVLLNPISNHQSQFILDISRLKSGIYMATSSDSERKHALSSKFIVE